MKYRTVRRNLVLFIAFFAACLFIKLGMFNTQGIIEVAQATSGAIASTQPGVSEGAVAGLPANRIPSNAPIPEIVSFPSSGLILRGYLYKPAGSGPFPAIVWNHGSEKCISPSGQIEQQPYLAAFYTSHGYIFFLPFRHGQGLSPGEYIMDMINQAKAQSDGNQHEFGVKFVAIQELYNKDVVAAVEWLKQQSYVDTKQIVMSGASFGGIQTIATSKHALGIKAYVPFAPGAMSWNQLPELQNWLYDLVKTANAPMFLIQADNDYSLGPSQLLGPELVSKGGLNQYKDYPAFLNPENHEDGHYHFACWPAAIAIWGSDVLSFIELALK